MDWRMMEAGLELDKLIVDRLGATNYIVSGLTGVAYVDWPGETLKGSVPEYSTDLNAALTLVPSHLERYVFILRTSDIIHWECVIETGDDAHHDYAERYGYAPTPALAVCRGWLAWDDAQTT